MRRRHLLAGIASLGTLGGAGAVATGNAPDALGLGGEGARGGNGEDGDDEGTIEPTTIPTIEAPGSRDDEVAIPAEGQATFVDFFGTWCPPCEEQMPALGEAADRIGDEVRFVSVTTEDVGGSVTEEAVVDWWRSNDGDWLVAADTTAELAAKLGVNGYPYAVALDATGRIAWSGSGTHTADEIVAGIENALDR
ncbi:TlpA family protein disulfide reductase [Halorubrum trueperi]|uniref:TlpA family protein disulfide reductase n=1 Tax=Halorubrum trueperi TaxID=2004704 RepID=A0ABD5UMD3_9EURY